MRALAYDLLQAAAMASFLIGCAVFADKVFP